MSKHPTLWYEDGTLVLQAEQTVFKVHRSILSRHSELFKDMLQLGQALDGEGTETKPLVVPLTDSTTMTELLGIIYGCAGTPLDANTETLVHVLRAAHRLQFDKVLQITAQALEAQTDLPAIRKFGLALTCSPLLDSWLRPTFQVVVLDFSSLKDSDAEVMLDDSTRIRIYQAREEITRLRLDFIFRLRGDIMTEHPSGGASLTPAERYAIIARVIPHTARRAFFKTALEVRTASAPHRTGLGRDLVDLGQQYLERWAPPHDHEMSIVAGMWDSFQKPRGS